MTKLFEKIVGLFEPEKNVHSRVLILAGNYQHACFCARTLLKLNNNQWNYVSSWEQLCGIHWHPTTKVYIYQTWMEHKSNNDLEALIIRLNIIKQFCEVNHIDEYGRVFPSG